VKIFVEQRASIMERAGNQVMRESTGNGHAPCPCLTHLAQARRRRVMARSEPPSTASSLHSRLFHIGRDSRGRWVVQDQQGLCGGLFVDRAEAVRFAMFESGHRPQAVIMVPGVLELDLSDHSHHSTALSNPTLARAA
jgi:hypothetical protein